MIENSEEIEPALIEELAKALQIAPDAIKNLSDELVINYIQKNNNYDGTPNNNNGQITIQNPIDKIMELYEENKKLHEEKNKLYEALLKEKDEKIALLQKLLDKK